jgi:uncharacterized protein YdeI (YjbR/CyaY-like superfamily)
LQTFAFVLREQLARPSLRLHVNSCRACRRSDAEEAAKRDGSWDVYDAVEQLTIPSDLEAAFADNKAAGQNFVAFSTSNKKQLLWYVASAKRPETRKKRIAQIVHAAAQNKNPLA